MLNDWLKRVAVLGAAGKMGRGISLLLLQEMARLEAETTGRVGSGDYQLVLIDPDEQGLNRIWSYLQPHLVKYAGQNINALRGYFAKRSDLIENGEMIQAFVEGALLILRRSQQLAAVQGSKMVFEAVAEDFDLKRSVYQTIKNVLDPSTLYLTNTSSIPIAFLDEQTGLNHRLIGFHFYNPPSHQKLVELICRPELMNVAEELGKRLGKTVVVSADRAGFIGNGHFMRELCYACERVQALSSTYGAEEALCLINRVSQQLLLRPMGIFQLVDYVGIDVCQKILAVMSCHIGGENFHCQLLDAMVSKGIRGGQDSTGGQQAGFFQYTSGKISEAYSLKEGRYCPEKTFFPAPVVTWGSLVKDPARAEKIKAHFDALSHDPSIGVQEARAYLRRSQEIAKQLVSSGVTTSIQNVNTVLQLGFSHLYGVDSETIT